MSAPTPDPNDFLAGYDCGHAVAAMNAYRQGHIDGYGLGYRQALEAAQSAGEADRDAWFTERKRALVQYLTTFPPYADLAELRGEHDRAEQQRRILRERGIIA